MSKQKTLQDTTSVISSPGSEVGHSPCDGQDLKASQESGPDPVPVSRFRARASDRATPIHATYGPLFTISSPSADLQRSLENRLRARMDVSGSPEYDLTWKDWDMPAGEPICALRASERHTGDKGCSGWLTPSAADGKTDGPKILEHYERHIADGTPLPCSAQRLRNQAQALCGWPTPNTPNGGRSSPEMSAGEMKDGHKRQVDLQHIARLAGWPTPEALNSEGYQVAGGIRYPRLGAVAALAGWPTCNARDWKAAMTPGNELTYNARPLNEVAMLAGLPLAGWPTPNTPNGGRSSPEMSATGMKDGHKRQADLQHVARLAGWPTPNTPSGGPNTQSTEKHTGGMDLEGAAILAGWPTSNAMEGGQTSRGGERKGEPLMGGLVGPASTSCPAGTEKRGVLNPNHSRWMMGYPLSWTLCGMLAFLKTKSARRSARSRSPSTPLDE